MSGQAKSVEGQILWISSEFVKYNMGRMALISDDTGRFFLVGRIQQSEGELIPVPHVIGTELVNSGEICEWTELAIGKPYEVTGGIIGWGDIHTGIDEAGRRLLAGGKAYRFRQ